jgi:hypothetical protein
LKRDVTHKKAMPVKQEVKIRRWGVGEIADLVKKQANAP